MSNFKDLWREYIRTGDDQSQTPHGSARMWKQYLFEQAELETVQEPLDPEGELNEPLPASDIPGELYHATRPPLLSAIAEEGLRDHSDFSKHGGGQMGVSFATALEPVATGAFGNLILVFDGAELAHSGQFEFRPHQDPTIDTPEAEVRCTMIDSAGSSGSGIDPSVDSLGTVIPFHFCRKLIFLYPLPKFEQKWLAGKFPHMEIQVYREEKQPENEE